MYIRKILLTFILVLAYRAVMALGLGAWSCYTPGNHLISCDHMTLVISLKVDGSRTLDSLDKWYFYKGFVVGIAKQHRDYFVLNEADDFFREFNRKEEPLAIRAKGMKKAPAISRITSGWLRK